MNRTGSGHPRETRKEAWAARPGPTPPAALELPGELIANVRVVANRRELLRIIPGAGVAAEIGVAGGDFSAQILAENRPAKLHLIDPWDTARYGEAELARVLSLVELDEEVFELGLRSTIDPSLDGGISEKILDTRIALRERLADPAISKYVELFDPEKYNSNASLAENLMFGTPVGGEFNLEAIANQQYVRFVLRKAGLE